MPRCAANRSTQFMAPAPDPLRVDADLHDAARQFAAIGESHLPVMDATGRYFGILSAHAVMDALAADEDTDLAALTASAAPVNPDATIGDVLRRLDHGDGAVAVTTAEDNLLGWIRHRDILTALTRTAGSRTVS